jgi:hypothetical protein
MGTQRAVNRGKPFVTASPGLSRWRAGQAYRWVRLNRPELLTVCSECACGQRISTPNAVSSWDICFNLTKLSRLIVDLDHGELRRSRIPP